MREYPDNCEWNPDTNQLAWEDDAHFLSTPATIILGADVKHKMKNGVTFSTLRVCDSCAALPIFRRIKRRQPIRKGDK